MTLGGLASVLGRYEDAETHFEEATELANRGGMKFFAARTRLEWGRMLIVRRGPGDLDRARMLLEQARSVAAAHGYAVVERGATTDLSDLT